MFRYYQVLDVEITRFRELVSFSRVDVKTADMVEPRNLIWEKQHYMLEPQNLLSTALPRDTGTC